MYKNVSADVCNGNNFLMLWIAYEIYIPALHQLYRASEGEEKVGLK